MYNSLWDEVKRLTRLGMGTPNVPDIRPQHVRDTYAGMQDKAEVPEYSIDTITGAAPTTSYIYDTLELKQPDELTIRPHRAPRMESVETPMNVKGVTALNTPKSRTVSEPQRSVNLTPQDLLYMTNQVLDPRSNVTGVEYNKDRGFKLSAAPPAQYTSEQTKELEEVPQAGFGRRASEFLMRPEVGYLMGQIASALVPENYAQKQLGQVGAQMHVNRALGMYKQKLEEGATAEELNSTTFNIIPPELKAQALQEKILKDREARAVKESEVGIRATEQQIAASKTQQAATPTWEQKFDQELTLAGLRNLAGDKNTWMGVGQGRVFNWRTGETKKLFDWERSEGADPQVQQRTWYNTARREAYDSLQRAGFGKVIELPNGEISFNWDNPEAAEANYKAALEATVRKYIIQGVLPESFMGIDTKPITLQDGTAWQVRADGNYERIK